jgi:hypothetical protein
MSDMVVTLNEYSELSADIQGEPDAVSTQKSVLSVKPRIDLHIGHCIDVLRKQSAFGFSYDAIITDPPYEIKMHGQRWDGTGITFLPLLWEIFYEMLKPGGFVAAFSSPRLYHRLATVVEDVGFNLYPFLTWRFDNGLPKPVNVSELFDRDNVREREVIGYRTGSGYTRANVRMGLQTRSSNLTPMYARHVSQEAQDWRGYYYGMTCLTPSTEPILLAQKPIDCDRMIDNLRFQGTGALNLGPLTKRYGVWPGTELRHNRDRANGFLGVKPVALMEDLCLMLCRPGGALLDPFAGTGTTGVAAQRLGYACTLIESNKAMEMIIRQRLGV